MFTFPLETLLKHRKFIEESLQKELALFKRSLDDEMKKLEALEKRKAALIDEFHLKLADNPKVWEISMFSDASRHLDLQIKRQKSRVSDAEKLSEQKRQHLLEAMKRRKMLDQLKEKRFDEYQQAIDRKEQEFMNEVAVGRFNRDNVPA